MLTRLSIPSHEEVYRVEDAVSGLRGFIALHSTRLGPAAGGLRMRVYDSDAAALEDVLNLSRGMSYKNTAAGLPLGGGKAVIIGDPARDKTPELLRAMGRAIDALGGRYWTAEDMGMSPADMAEIARETRFVAGRDQGRHASGDPSPVTAGGVLSAMRAGAAKLWGSGDLRGRHVAVQGLGHVGWHLVPALARGRRAVERGGYGRRARGHDRRRIRGRGGGAGGNPCRGGGYPCALRHRRCAERGHDPEIRAAMVCGAANNQLATPEDADRLHARGILYLPDYVANGGGIINVSAEILEIADRDAMGGRAA